MNNNSTQRYDINWTAYEPNINRFIDVLIEEQSDTGKSRDWKTIGNPGKHEGNKCRTSIVVWALPGNGIYATSNIDTARTCCRARFRVRRPTQIASPQNGRVPFPTRLRPPEPFARPCSKRAHRYRPVTCGTRRTSSPGGVPAFSVDSVHKSIVAHSAG